jgi:circadian clock protein KaiC
MKLLTTGRVRTGIIELDEMLHGGFLQRDTVMIAGSAGSGKTTLVLQYLVNGASQFGENGLFVTFEQLPDQLYRDAAAFGWDLRQLERENKFRLVCTSPDLLMKQSPEGGYILDEVIRQIGPKRIAIDSLSHLEMYVKRSELRREAYRLIRYLNTKGLSSIFTWEAAQDSGHMFSTTEVGLSFLVDCIVFLRFVEIESSLRKALVIMKMRGSDHDKELREYMITSSGIRVATPFTEYEGIVTGTPRKVGADQFVEILKRAGKKAKS